MPPTEEALTASHDLAAAIQYDLAALFNAHTVTMVEESAAGGRFTFDNGNGVVLEVLVRPSQEVEEEKAIFKTFIENALVMDYYGGMETCLYCSFSRAFLPEEEADRLLDNPEEGKKWWAEMQAASLHDESCPVTRLCIRLGLPNPRAVYPEREESHADHPEGP